LFGGARARPVDCRAAEGSIEDNPRHSELLEIARMARHDFLLDVENF